MLTELHVICFMNDQGNVCIVQNGALYRAVKRGYWFVADEFNLADPAVMSMLFPLLEGRPVFVSPVTGEAIRVHPNFRFFATQVCTRWLHLRSTPSTELLHSVCPYAATDAEPLKVRPM